MKSILITGCNRGLGLGLIKSLIKHEKSPKFIFATCRNLNAANELKGLAEINDKLHILEIDLKDYDKYPELVKQVQEVVKDEGLNVLFNSAGISPRSSFMGIRGLKASELMDTYAVNCVAPLMLSKAFIPLLKMASENNQSLPLGASRALIMNMSSILGSIKLNTDGSLYHYRVTKSGVNAATKSLSIDLKNEKIMATAIHPGMIFRILFLKL
ncbi:hypothetical protein ACKWTF_005249 [Chironomus riparius]